MPAPTGDRKGARRGVRESMAGGERGRPYARPRRPVAAAVATLVGGASMVAYSAFYLSAAVNAYLHCNPVPRGIICTYHPFWGFSPTFFLLADVVGLVAGGTVTALGLLVWMRPRAHTVLGAVVLACSAASVLAYGGGFVGLAAGAAGGILAIVYKAPKFRELSQWSAPHTGGHAEAVEVSGARAAPRPAVRAAGPGSLSEDAYAPLPPVLRRYVTPPAARGGAPPPAESPSAPVVATPRYGSLANALGGTPPRPSPAVAPRPAPATVAHPPLPAAASEASPRRARREPTSPPGTASTAAPPAKVVAPAVSSAPAPSTIPSTTPSTPPVGGVAGAPQRPWKCPHCGLTNAPWSKTCTRCRTPVPIA